MSHNCECSDYVQMSAKTGIVTINSANSNLNGSGLLGTVLVGGQNGTIIKSIIIKSTNANNLGMIRLFVGKGGQNMLYREIPIPIYPNTPNTPTPTPIWPMLEINLLGNLKLENGTVLLASTQNSETFNIIAEGMDLKYPTILPSVCCNFKEETILVGVGNPTQNKLLNGTGNITPIFTSSIASNGSIINSITVSALQSTHSGMVRIFINNGVDYKLMMEVVIPETTQSSFQQSYKQELKMDFALQAGFSLGATTENSDSFSIVVNATEWIYK